MLTVLIRILTLNAENVIPEVIWALMVIYILAVLLTLTSVWSIYKSVKGRLFWSVLVLSVPFLGVIAHCFYCLTHADIDVLKQFGFFTRKAA